MHKLKQLSPLLGTSVAAGLVLSVLAPYGTHDMPFPPRFLFWVGLCVAGGLGTAVINGALAKHVDALNSWQRVVVQSLGATAAVWVCFWVLTYVTRGLPALQFYAVLPFYIWVVSVVICTIGELMRIQKASAPETARAALFERLKPPLRSAEIYALSAEDHYVRVHTSKGDDLILMRLSDAVRETEPLKGILVHRSWWVAENGVKKTLKADGKIMLRLQNDIEAPVSRNNQKAVRSAGWV